MLEVTGLESRYGRIPALRGVSLQVRPGELVALVGANGAGKTTLLRALSGVQPVTSGRIALDGREITAAGAARRVRLGMVQVPEGRQVFAPLSVEDNLRLGAYTRPRFEAEATLERVYAAFPALHAKRATLAGMLSGGQQQLLAIGRALMARPRLLLLDEPSMGLAPRLVTEIFDHIAALRATEAAVFLADQNANAALRIADRGYVLETGAIALEGAGTELLANERVRAAYLGL
jgi:branched-chain amino acid transport system ATP-binding protein